MPGDGGIQASQYTPHDLNEPTLVMVQLGGETIAEMQAKQPSKKLSASQKNKIKADLASKQDSIKPAIASLGGTVVNDFQAAYNGISVQIPLGKVADLRKLSNVVGVHAIQADERTHTTSVPYIGTPEVWNGATGFRGDNIKIAIIDTGLDYTHANFGGPGTSAAYVAANAADTLPANPAHFGPNAPKVKGGIDLVGDDFNASANNPDGTPNVAARTPHPDPNPLDCNGHGSHVGGSAAGFGVLADGTTYGDSPSETYDPSTFTPGKFRIGPGVAPRAHLYGVRVFGCLGSTNVTVDAIEWAVDNGMDVINMSLGSVFGTNDNPSSVAATNAAKAGVIVIAAAGNNGANQYTTASPGVADSIVSVAASDANPSFPGFSLTLPSGAPIQAINANGATVADGTSYGIVTLFDNAATPTVDESLGCNVSDYPPDPEGNTVAVTIRGVCARVGKAIRGQQAGYEAVAMVDNTTNLPPFEGAIFRHPDTGEEFTVTIPFIGVRGLATTATSDGARLRAANGGTTTLTNILLPNTNHTGFAGFTSAGPRNGDSALQPGVTAPGVSIFSTGVGTGNAPGINSGTSMASPHVAGVAALVKQAHPGWKQEDLHAAIVNTGNPGAIGGTAPYRVSRGGTGLVQPVGATKTQVVAFGPKEQFSLSFGFDERKDQFDKSETLHIRNNSSTRATFDLSLTNQTTGSPHTVSLGKSSISVPARGSAGVAVKLNVPMTTAGNSTQTSGGLNFREVAGLVTLTPTGGSNNGVALRVPYYFVPRAISQIEAKIADSQLDGPSFATTATVENKSDSPIAGTADFYNWGLEDGNDLGKSPADIRAIGVQSFPPFAGLPPHPSGPNRLVVFGVSSWHRWSTASTQELQIRVDVDPQNNNGPDYRVVGVDQGAIQAGVFNGRTAAFVFSFRSPGSSVVFFASAPTDSSTSLLPVVASQLCRGPSAAAPAGEPCLSQANPRFTYASTAFDLISGGVDQVTGTASYNAWNSSISQGGFASLNPGQSANVPIAIDPAEWALTPSKGIMVVSQDNQSGKDEAALLEVKRD